MEVFEAIAQPKRREILRLLAAGERTAGDIAGNFAVTQPAISQHLKVLKDTGLVHERRDGTRRLYSVRSQGLQDLHGFLADVLPGRLEDLKRVVEDDRRSGRGRDTRRN